MDGISVAVAQGAGEEAGDGKHRIDLPVTGMTCAACVRRVERALSAVPGVRAVSVNLTTERASVTAAPGLAAPGLALPGLVAALTRAGYPAAEDTLDLHISGMTCASCAGRVERALRRVPGVVAADVNLATEQARIRLLANATQPGALLAAVRAAGYAATLFGAPAAPSRRFGDGLAALAACLLAAPLLLPMLLMPFGFDAALPATAQFVLATLVQALFGTRFYRGAWHALRAGTGSMDILVALGTTAAYALSVAQLATDTPGHLYFEASATVIALVRVGKWLESRARRQAGAAIRALGHLRPERARTRRDGTDHDVDAAVLRPGDLLVVRPGERIAADGIIREGAGTADESLLTGESRPVPKRPGSEVIGGSLNGDALLLVEATATGAESRLDQLVRLVEDVQASKPPVQRLVDRVCAVFVPAVVVLALVTFAAWSLAGAAPSTALVNAVSVLVIACPCALGLATPAAIAAGTGIAARHGILIRDPAALERAGAIRTVVFDKTGTLTEGRPALTAQLPAPGQDAAALLRLAAALARNSEHPLARAISATVPDAPPAADLRALPGRGMTGTVENRTLLLGSARLMADEAIDTSPLVPAAARAEAACQTVSFLAERHGPLLGLLTFGDPLRPGAREAVGRLADRGVRTVLLTGDNPGAARAVATALRIGDTRAQALPEDKAAAITSLRAAGPVAMVGDGVNDAAALAAADLGIAVATGTDVAAAAAAITLMRPDPGLVPDALDIAARTHARIRQGLLWAFAYNLVGLPLAASGLLSPVVAGAAMAFSSSAVVANALLLRRWRPQT